MGTKAVASLNLLADSVNSVDLLVKMLIVSSEIYTKCPEHQEVLNLFFKNYPLVKQVHIRSLNFTRAEDGVTAKIIARIFLAMISTMHKNHSQIGRMDAFI